MLFLFIKLKNGSFKASLNYIWGQILAIAVFRFDNPD